MDLLRQQGTYEPWRWRFSCLGLGANQHHSGEMVVEGRTAGAAIPVGGSGIETLSLWR